MNKKLSLFITFFILSILIFIAFSGCIEKNQKREVKKVVSSEINLDQPSILPNWKDGKYHDYYGTTEMLNYFNDKYPDLVKVFSIGKSVLDLDIWCIRLTNEKNNYKKLSCLIDGCIHGNEWEAGEACLYLAEYLLINFDENKTITNILNSSEIYLVPLVNPDGRQADTRWNDNGVDLNRNFDVHFGRLRSGNYPLGKLFGFIKIPYIRHPLRKNSVLGEYSSNCGRHAFSEPETQALSDLMRSLNNYAFYVNCHTAMHGVIPIVNVDYKPEYIASQQEKKVYNFAEDWIDENTEYSSCHVDDFSFSGAGFAHHWVFKEFRIPSYTFEILSPDHDPFFWQGKHDHLVHWMKTTLPVFMYFLVNIENLYNWEMPDIQPSLPEGVPPQPLK